MEETQYKVGIYVRESRDDNGDKFETVEVQRDLLINYVQKNFSCTVIGVYMDDNVSGSTFERRELERLKGDIVAGNVNLLVVKDLSRLGRNNTKTLMFLDFLEEYSVRVVSYDGRYDSLRDNDTVGIDTWYNERYIRDISRKIRASLKFKIDRGEYLGNAPYGYIKSNERKNKLCIDRTKAGIVKEIFDLYKIGHGYSNISKILNSKGYISPSAVGQWNAVAVKRILGNEVYTGVTIQGVSEKISFKSKKTRRLPRDRWVFTEATHEVIISIEDFKEVQNIRQNKTKGSGRNKGEIHLFKDLMFCGNCGSSMYARRRQNRPLGYICSNYAKNGIKACTSHHVNEEFLKQLISNEIIEKLKEEKIWNAVSGLLLTENSKQLKYEDEIKRLEQLITSKYRQQETLYLDKLEGKITEQLFMRMNTNIENRLVQLKNEIERKEKLQNCDLNWEEKIKAFCSEIGQGVLTNEMMKLLIRKINVFDCNMRYNKEREVLEESPQCLKEGDLVIEFGFK
jgi:site-specific DNA recombinase